MKKQTLMIIAGIIMLGLALLINELTAEPGARLIAIILLAAGIVTAVKGFTAGWKSDDNSEK